MNKKLFLSLFISFLLFTSFLFLNNQETKAATESDVFLLITNPGEDMSTQMHINYHTNISGTFVELALKSDGNFDNSTKVYGECAAPNYGFEGTNFGIDWGLNKEQSKFVCEVNLTNLTPGTEYMYRAGKTVMSPTYYFNTADDDGRFTFAVMADPQIYGTSNQTTANNNMNNAMQIAASLNLKLELVLGAGDMVNQGGIINNWRMLFDLDIYKQMPLAASTGNHDYCDGGNAKAPTSVITDYVYNNPKNSYPGKTEGMYWFKFDNTLFICMDSEENSKGYDDQINWFIDICERIPHQYLIVFCHRPPWGSSDSDAVAAKWVPVFNKYNIDLFFSGHNHDYGRGSTKVGPARGQAKFPNRYVAVDDTYNASNAEAAKGGYCIVNVTPTAIFYRAYDQEGTCRDQAVFPAQRTNNHSTTFTKSSFMDSIKAEVVDTNTTRATLSWSAEGYGHVNYITLSKTSGALVKNVFANSDINTSFEFSGLKANTDYTYHVKVDFKDGTSEEKTINFATRVDYGTYSEYELTELSTSKLVVVKPGDIKTNLLSAGKIYINDVYVEDYTITSQNVRIKNEWLTSENNVIKLYGVVKSNSSLVLLLTIDLSTPAAEPTLAVDKKTVTIEADKTASVGATIENSTNKLVWSTSDASVATVANGVITAVAEGTAIITIALEGTELKQEIMVTVKAKPAVKLAAPSISLSNGILTVNAVTNAVKYEVYDGTTLIATLDVAGTLNLVDLNLAVGAHDITVKAVGDGVTTLTSDASSKTTFTVAAPEKPIDEPEDPKDPEDPSKPEEPTERGCNNSAALQFVLYLFGVFTVLFFVRKKFF